MSTIRVDVIDVPFDGYGRAGHQSAAPAAYREAGLLEHATMQMRQTPAMRLPASTGERGPLTGLLNEAALFAAIDGSASAVSSSLSSGGFPLVVGGDCSVLVGVFGGARATDDAFGLLFIDGHEDTTPLDVVDDGEAANTELGLLLGTTGRTPSYPRPELTGILRTDRLAAVGMRDHELRRTLNIGSVRELDAFHRSAEQTRTEPGDVALAATAHLGGRPWWLHVDLDVLDPTELPATRVPGESEQALGGLTWSELETLTTVAAGQGGCRGLSVAIYDPEQDTTRTYPRRIVELIHSVLVAATTSPRHPSTRTSSARPTSRASRERQARGSRSDPPGPVAVAE